ncbi:MAG TPA: YkgJ family cysteine cluster protein [Pseudomonadota bacterium]|nr:YkgJ family cysteine cluster protein [Pseudomonadota bacterium]
MAAIFFAFLDGAFRYDCARCGQACCRGKGVALAANRELVPLLRRVPQVAPLLTPLPGGYVKLPDVTDGCWFLGDDGMCSYERSHGRDAKFTTCRLFPFNRVFRVGSAQVVDVNSVVCPIEDALTTGHGVTHAELSAELSALGSSPLTESSVNLPPGARELRWLALETTLRDESAQFLGDSDYLAFARHMQATTAKHLGLRGEIPDTIGRLGTYFTEIYGALASPHGPAIARGLTLLSPSLRFNALFRKNADDYRRLIKAQPGQLLATFVQSLWAAATWNRPLSLRAQTELHQAQTDLRTLLARLHEPAQLHAALAVPDLPPELQDAAKRLHDRLSRPTAAKQPVGDILVDIARELPSEKRALVPTLLLRAGESLRFVEAHP